MGGFGPRHAFVVLVYLGLLATTALLKVVFLMVRPKACAAGANRFWAKYVTYIGISSTVMFCAWAGHHLLTALLALIGGLAAYEVARLSQRLRGYRFLSAWLFGLTTATLIIGMDSLTTGGIFRLFVSFILLHTTALAFIRHHEWLSQKIAVTAASVLYFPVMIGCLIFVQQHDPTGFAVVFLYILVGVNDGFAQVIGQALGRHHLAARLSPSKTVEGALGGLVCTVAAGVVLRACLPAYPWWRVAAVASAIAVAGTVGDLVASSWKRFLEVKDFSAMLRATGGILDRFDSLMVASGVFFLLVTF